MLTGNHSNTIKYDKHYWSALIESLSHELTVLVAAIEGLDLLMDKVESIDSEWSLNFTFLPCLKP